MKEAPDNEQQVYEPPRALRVGGLLAGDGGVPAFDCMEPGSSATGCGEPGNNAEIGPGCENQGADFLVLVCTNQGGDHFV